MNIHVNLGHARSTDARRPITPFKVGMYGERQKPQQQQQQQSKPFPRSMRADLVEFAEPGSLEKAANDMYRGRPIPSRHREALALLADHQADALKGYPVAESARAVAAAIRAHPASDTPARTGDSARRGISRDADPDVSISADGAYTESDHERMAESHFDAAREAAEVGNTDLQDAHEHAGFLHEHAADALAADHADALHASHRAAKKSQRMRNRGIRW